MPCLRSSATTRLRALGDATSTNARSKATPRVVSRHGAAHGVAVVMSGSGTTCRAPRGLALLREPGAAGREAAGTASRTSDAETRRARRHAAPAADQTRPVIVGTRVAPPRLAPRADRRPATRAVAAALAQIAVGAGRGRGLRRRGRRVRQNPRRAVQEPLQVFCVRQAGFCGVGAAPGRRGASYRGVIGILCVCSLREVRLGRYEDMLR